MPPRRFQLVFATIIFLFVTLTLFGPPTSADLPTVEQLTDTIKDSIKNPHIPTLGPSAHRPPVQQNSTSTSSYGSGVIEWFSDFKWRNPFSSSVTYDETRALLPPFKDRPPVYTYYEPQEKSDKAVVEAENKLLLAWRRAWWAQGFQPLVLSRAEAMKNPFYQRVQGLKLDSKVEFELMRWLAWDFMGVGILTNWLALPMAPYDDSLLSFLRRKEYPQLTHIKNLQNAIFFAEGSAVNNALKRVIDDPLFKNATASADQIAELGKKEGGIMVNILPEEDLNAWMQSDGVAYYSKETISEKYKAVSEKLANGTQAEGLDELATLINSHLHLTFQNTFKEGVAVVKPLPEHTTALMYEAIDIARNLTQCPTSPIPDSCPPNRPKCTPCDPSHPLPLKLLPSYKNSSSLYSVGTVPHPYTLTSLHYTRDELAGDFVRRTTKRDSWIHAATKELLGDKASGERRVLHFKDAVAALVAPSNSLWLTAERESQVDIDWIFGFTLPRAFSDAAPSAKPTPGPQPRRGMPEPLKNVDVPEERWILTEEVRLRKAREALKSKDRRMQKIVDMVEKWNLYDTEAWKFARAWSARRKKEREQWEEDEGKFAGTERKAGVHNGGGGGGRWSD
jgi:hypothetical protein